MLDPGQAVGIPQPIHQHPTPAGAGREISLCRSTGTAPELRTRTPTQDIPLGTHLGRQRGTAGRALTALLRSTQSAGAAPLFPQGRAWPPPRHRPEEQRPPRIGQKMWLCFSFRYEESWHQLFWFCYFFKKRSLSYIYYIYKHSPRQGTVLF